MSPLLFVGPGVALMLARLALRGVTRRAAGWAAVAALLGAAGLSTGLSTGLVAQGAAPDALAVAGTMPRLDVGGQWLNSPPLTRKALAGKVVLVDFWTYSCINCLRTLPYLKAWNDKYARAGLVIVGVHAPEFDFEKDTGNVKKAIARFGVTWPVVQDNDLRIWNAFDNQYWPAHYLIDAQGRIRDSHFGEGDYDGTERAIRQLLAEAHPGTSFGGIVVAPGRAEMAASSGAVGSPETYIGYSRAEGSVSVPAIAPNRVCDYGPLPHGGADLERNQWALIGPWTVAPQMAFAGRAGGQIVFRFHARDLHLVLGPSSSGRPIRFHVTLDGHAPGEDQGVDVDATGAGAIDQHRLYNLIRLRNPGADHTFAIRFDDLGAQAFSFTFG